MSLFEFELLKIRRNHYFNIFFVLLIAVILLVGMSFEKEGISDYSVSIGYLNYDASEASREYLEKLSKKDIIDLVELPTEEEGKRKLSNSVIEGMIVIPENFFDEVLKSKITYYYLEYGVIAPAVTDLLADDLMLSVSKAKLIDAIKRYLSEDKTDRALYYYNDFLRNNSFFLETQLSAVENAKGLRTKYDAKKISHGRNVIGYAMVLFIFTLVFSSAVSEFKLKSVNYRKLSINGFYTRSFLWQRGFDYLKISSLWIMLVLTVSSRIGLRLQNALILLCFSIVILMVYYELITFFYRAFDKSLIGNLIAIGFVMLSSIFGGAYFPTDLFPKLYDVLLGWIPFYQLNKCYYSCISGEFTWRQFGYFGAYIAVAGVFAAFNYRRGRLLN